MCISLSAAEWQNKKKGWSYMQDKEFQVGRASIQFPEGPRIIGRASVVGKKEGEGPLGDCFDVIEPDPMVGCEN